jgi:hypothetical protein
MTTRLQATPEPSSPLIDQAIGLLEGVESSHPPAVTYGAPDEFVHGNQAGLVRLAIAALRTAQGQDQLLEREPWLLSADIDSPLSGFKYDKLTHMELPEKPTRIQSMKNSLILVSVLGFVTVAFIAGLANLADFIRSLIRHFR